MNESRTFRDEGLGGPSRPPLGEDLLPPVEQPSAKFIMQLFIVPALIVMAIVGIWFTFTTLVRSTTVGADKLIEGIEKGPSVARWQRASELADRLQNKGYADLKHDRARAAQLAQILNRELERSGVEPDKQEDVTLRVFLARALGEFEVADGTDVLLKAAQTKRSSNDELVRQAALEAIAVRAYNLPRLEPPQELSHPDLEPMLLRLAGDEDAAIRQRATYALGKLGTPAAIEKLQAAVDDPDADTRYNAAIALAHRGDATGAGTLAEMLDVKELAKQPEKPADARSAGFRNHLVIASAIDATHSLVRQNSQADLSGLNKALEDLANVDRKVLDEAGVPRQIASDAKHALAMMKSKK